MKKKIAFLLSACMLVGTLAACGGKPADGGAADGGAGTQGAAASDNSLKLVLSTTDGSSTDDKVPTPWYNRRTSTNLMFRSLFLADSSLTKATPDLAAEMPTVSEDGLTYTVKLKDNLKWSDGEPLTVDDVIWSIETAPKTTQVNPIYTSTFEKIKEMSADGNTITMKLSTPTANLTDVLAQFAILPKHSLEKVDVTKIDSDQTFWQNPVTNGYYMVNEFNVGNYFTLKPNPNYEGTPAKIEKVTVSYVTDYLAAAQSGVADLLWGNELDLVEALSKMENYTTTPVDVLYYRYLIFNMKGVDGNQNEAMQNPAVRKALIEAIDSATLAALYPNANQIHSGVPMSDPAYNGFEYKFDTEKAKADIKASGYDMNRPIRICYYNNDQTSVDLVNYMVYNLEQIGLKAEATLSNDGTTDFFTTRAYDIGLKNKSAFSLDEWYSEYLSTDALFQNIWGGDTAFDAAVTALAGAATAEEKTKALQELQKLEQEKMYKVPLFTLGNYFFTSNKIVLPEGVSFCNPLYNCDVDYANWTLA